MTLISAMHEDGPQIVVKKYANRRLYNVTHSQHLTLDELLAMIKKGASVSVIDSKTKKDITQSVLLQVILDEERGGTHLFSASFLHQLIRNKDGIVEEFFTDFVPKLLESYMEMKDLMRRQLATFSAPKHWLAQHTPKGMPFLGAFEQEPSVEVQQLKQRIAELEEQLSQKSSSQS